LGDRNAAGGRRWVLRWACRLHFGGGVRPWRPGLLHSRACSSANGRL